MLEIDHRFQQRWIAEAKINIGARGWFVICHRPGEELLEVPANGGKITSTLDTDVEMDIPKNTFERPGSISFKVKTCQCLIIISYMFYTHTSPLPGILFNHFDHSYFKGNHAYIIPQVWGLVPQNNTILVLAYIQ